MSQMCVEFRVFGMFRPHRVVAPVGATAYKVPLLLAFASQAATSIEMSL